LCGTLPQFLHFLPEFLPFFAFRFGQFGQSVAAPHTGEVGVLESVLHPLCNQGAGLARGVPMGLEDWCFQSQSGEGLLDKVFGVGALSVLAAQPAIK
jgi:hypothetical protein